MKLSLDIILKRFNITEFATGRSFFRQKTPLIQEKQQFMCIHGGIVTHVLFTPIRIEATTRLSHSVIASVPRRTRRTVCAAIELD
jgi:hypothetical protein